MMTVNAWYHESDRKAGKVPALSFQAPPDPWTGERIRRELVQQGADRAVVEVWEGGILWLHNSPIPND